MKTKDLNTLLNSLLSQYKLLERENYNLDLLLDSLEKTETSNSKL